MSERCNEFQSQPERFQKPEGDSYTSWQDWLEEAKEAEAKGYDPLRYLASILVDTESEKDRAWKRVFSLRIELSALKARVKELEERDDYDLNEPPHTIDRQE